MSIAAHKAAVLALLHDELVTVHRGGEVPDHTPLPYVVIYIDNGNRYRDGLEGSSDRAQFYIQTTCVGSSDEQVTWVADRIFLALLDAHPAVEGYSTSSIVHINSQPPRPDFDVTPHVVYAVDQWRLTSTR